MKVLARFLGTLFVASVAIFLLMRIVPGNPARVALGVNATDDAVAELTTALGLDRPLATQYWEWITGLLRGDFGTSLSSQQDITPLVLDRAQVSLIIVSLAMLLALAGALPIGVWLARRNGTPAATAVTALTQVGIAVPSFLVGIVLAALFAVRFSLLPANGWTPPNAGFGFFLAHLVMPVISLALVQGAMLTRYVRSAILDVAEQDYIRTARALGASRTGAIYRHGLRNAALPVLTVAGLQLTTLIVGAVVIESVFVVPGLGTMLLDAVSVRDLTTVQTLVMLLVAFTLTVNLLIDVAYRLVDPRLKGARS
ncbi:ABC transporter permease [uncultured Corynebacterium sp.]|uniref:ABC transporter permease n=1 Tax=uncultured Corynebacterium sp. TaxID=159447 RepID=UPI0025D9E1B6|nr:ABC transporter permease [uncultured Corynebacterium sp.]